MRCYEHRDAESVGICKSCQRGLCEACAAPVDRSLACRGHCEEAVALLDELTSRRGSRVGGAFRVLAVVLAALGAALLLGGYVIATDSGSPRGLLGAVLALIGVVMFLAAVLWGLQAQRWSAGRSPEPPDGHGPA